MVEILLKNQNLLFGFTQKPLEKLDTINEHYNILLWQNGLKFLLNFPELRFTPTLI